jgi:hypothetical protein
MRFTFLNPAVVAAVCVLSGCEAMQGALFKPAQPPNQAGTPAKGATRTTTSGDRQTAAFEPPARPGVKPSRPNIPGIDPKLLIGKNQNEAEAVLGPPSAVQAAPPATIWQYKADGCTLDVFFYMDMGSNSLRALAYDAKLADPPTNEETIAQCVGLVQVTNRARGR